MGTAKQPNLQHQRSRQLAAAIGALFAGSTVMTSAHAQDPAGPGAVLEEVTVTGSRIERTGMTTPTPVTTLGQDEIDTLSPGLLMDAIGQLPQFYNNVTADPQATGRYAAGGEGQSFVNMRGMGANRTLVLLDGRRVVPTSNVGSNDVNLFPEALIRRLEIVTGGASAAYGSDAVTGVTNFILDTDYTGVSVRAQGGITHRGDMPNGKFSLTFGTPLGDRVHVIGSAEYFHSESLRGWEKRSWFQDWALIQNPDPAGPALITVPNVGTRQYTYGGLILDGPAAWSHFQPDGTLIPFREGDIIGTNTQSGGDGVNIRRQMEIRPLIERRNAFLYGSFDVTDATTVYGQGIFARSTGDYRTSQTALHDNFGRLRIFNDNAFLPESLRQAMNDAGVESFTMGRRSSLSELQQTRGSGNWTQSYTAGVDHEFANGWQVNAYYQYGFNERDNSAYTTRLDRVYRAADAVVDPATGRIVCRSTLTFPDDGCVPANFFGEGNVSAGAEDYIMDWRIGTIEVKQHAGELAAAGEVHPGWGAGAVYAAVGVSYREDLLHAHVRDDVGDNIIPPDHVMGYRGLPAPLHGRSEVYLANEMLEARGGYNVSEAFTEFALPLVSNHALANLVELNLSARYADYSGSGGVFAWKSGLDWQVNSDVRLRATTSRDTRAANLGERFIWLRSSGGVDNPWLGTTGQPPADGTIAGGNPEVGPELSDTLTFGVVYQPSRISGLSLSMDYYSVDIKDAIAQVGIGNIVQQCFLEGSFCHLVIRDPNTNEILRVDNIYINLDEARVRGWDVEARYRWNPAGAHNFNFRLLTSYLQENSIATPLGTKIDRAGVGTYPKLTGTAMAGYSNGPYNASLSARYIGDATINQNRVEGVHVDRNRVSGATYLNLRLGYRIDTGNGDLSLFGNVENLLDRSPPLAVNTLSNWTGSTHTNSNFDQIGRRYTVGIRYDF